MNSALRATGEHRRRDAEARSQAWYPKETPRCLLIPRDMGLSSAPCRSCFHTAPLVNSGGTLALGAWTRTEMRGGESREPGYLLQHIKPRGSLPHTVVGVSVDTLG